MSQHQPRTRSTTRTPHAREKHENTDQMDGRRSPEWPEGDDSGWEDEHDQTVFNEANIQRTVSPSGSAHNRTSPRKRRRPAFPVNGSRRQVSTIASTTPNRPSQKTEDRPAIIVREDVVDGAIHGAVFTSRYMIDVFSRAIHFLRYPLSFVVFLWLLGFIVTRVGHTLRIAVAPLCIIPGFSSSSVCRWDPRTPSRQKGTQWADYPNLVQAQSKTFEQLMDESAGGSALSLELKKAEMATTDLVTLVRISDLKAKNSLASSLVEFVENAKKTGRGLQKLTSKVAGAVDNIMVVNDYALQSIESARANEPSALSLSNLVPWKPKRKSTKLIVRETFEEAMNVFSNNMQRLILEAEANMINLNDLEERLNTLHELVSREDSSLSSAKSELLAELWTILGGNKRTLRNYDSHLALLKDLSSYRKQALIHVVSALQTLRAMSEDMEDMRERVSAPDLIGESVPVEVHIKSIEMGLERLREGRIKAKRMEEDAIRRILGGEDDD